MEAYHSGGYLYTCDSLSSFIVGVRMKFYGILFIHQMTEYILVLKLK